ncbi:MAG: hypothetical protein M0030_01090 [Actinomycetota bacterium]|nr:hypothetical protein [Actinomycetota bacterium]
MSEIVIIVAKVLGIIGFLSLMAAFMWFIFPRSKGRLRGDSVIYLGGMRSARLTGSWGTVRLELSGTGISIRGRGPFAPFTGWESDYSRLGEVRAIRGMKQPGLLFREPNGPIVFWTPRWSEILDLLELREVPVNRTVTKIDWGIFR